jgi:transcriptional regulator with XRE-family HTH domain
VDRELSQQELGAPEFSASYLSRIESGDRAAPLPTLRRLAERLGCDVAFLLTGVRADHRDELRRRLHTCAYALANGDIDRPALAAEVVELRAAVAAVSDVGLAGEVELLAARGMEQFGDHVGALRAWRPVLDGAVVGTATWTEAAVAVTRLHRLVGDVSRAIEVGERCRDLLDGAGLGDTPGAVQVALTLMAGFLERGDLQQAVMLGEDAQRRAAAAGDAVSLGRAFWNCSAALLELGDPAGAAELAGQAVASLQGGKQPRTLALVQLVLAQCLTLLGRTAEAAGLVEEAFRVLAVVGTSTDVGYVQLELARIALSDGRFADVVAHAETLIAGPGVAPIQAAEARLLAGRAEAGRRRPAQARKALRASASTLAAIEAGRMAGRVWVELAAALDEVDDVAGARDAYRAAAACAGLVPASASAALAMS